MNDRPSIVVPALVGGVFLGITSGLPLLNLVNCACCILIIGGGMLASLLYLRDYPHDLPPMTYGDGAVLGILTGVFGGLVWSIVEIPLSFVKRNLMPELDMAELEQTLPDVHIPPELQEVIRQLLENSGEISVGLVLFGLLVNLSLAVVFATIGAIIGVALFQKTPQPAAPPPYSPPPPAPPAA